jgi:DNA-binding NtrC family response regulator
VFRAVVLADGDMLDVDEFPQIAALVGPVPATVPAAEAVRIEAFRGGDGRGEAGRGEAPRVERRRSGGGWSPNWSSGWSPGPGGLGNGPAPFGFLRSLDDDGHVRSLDAIEAEMIRIAISHYGGRMSEVARRLGIGRSTLYRKLKDHGLDENGDLAAAE